MWRCLLLPAKLSTTLLGIQVLVPGTVSSNARKLIVYAYSALFHAYLSIAHSMVPYAMTSGGMKNRTWFLDRRKTFQKPFAMKVAMGRCRFGLSEYVTTLLPGRPPPSYGLPHEPMCHLQEQCQLRQEA